MFRFTHYRIQLIVTFFFLLFSPLSPVYAAQDWGTCVVDGVATIQCIVPLFANLVVAVVGLAGLALFIMFIVAGFNFLTGGGNPKQMEKAQQTLTYAIIGLVVLICSYLIIKLVGAFVGIPTLDQFTVPSP